MTHSSSSSKSIFFGDDWTNDELQNIGNPVARSSVLPQAEQLSQPSVDNFTLEASSTFLSAVVSESAKDSVNEFVMGKIAEPVARQGLANDNVVRTVKNRMRFTL